MADIVVKINADAKQFNEAIDEVKKKTSDLEDTLSSVAKASGIVFGALVGSAALAIKAFGDAEKATNELSNALKNQGLSVDKNVKSYKQYADVVSKATGIDDDAIVAAQAKLQAYIGQTEITQELTTALVDLSTETGSLDSAAEKLGLAFQGNIGFFNKQRIAVDENATSQERLDQAVAGVTKRMGGQAAAAAQGVGSIKRLEVSFGNLLENVGERLAPAFEKGVLALDKFINSINTPEVLDFAVGIGKVVAVFAGGIATLSSAGLAFLKLKQTFDIVNIGIKALGLSARGALLASGIGALVVAATLIYEYWDDIFPRIKAIFVGAMTGVVEAASGVGKILKGVFTKDFESISAGVDQFRNSLSKGFDAGSVTLESEIKKQKDSGGDTGQNTELLKAKEAEATAIRAKGIADRKRLDDINREQNLNSIEIATLQATQGSEELVKLKQQENELLKQLETEKNAAIIDALNLRLATVRALEEEARTADAEERQIFNEQILAQNDEFNKLSAEQKTAFLQQQGAALKSSIDTETEAKVKFVAADLKQQIDAHNLFLQEQQKYGTAYAAINQAMQTQEVQGFTKGVSQLTALQNSKSKELKTIGKAAAVADITIKTAQAALAAYAGFAAIPIVGIPLGIAAAGAVIAFGAEQIGTVLSAQTGGIVPGANFGGDSQKALLQPGELIVPRSNFDEVVNSVANARQTQSVQASSGVNSSVTNNQAVAVDLRFSGDNAEKFLTARQVESRALGTIRESA